MPPTPAKWREHAAHARQMANEARAYGDCSYADRRDDDADFYEFQAELEEWNIARRGARHAPIILGEAA